MPNFLFIAALCILLASCAVGPDYVKPKVEKPEAFKESKDWKVATPKDLEIKEKWWESFGDGDLNALEEQVFISNQNIKAAEAAYRQARALVSEAKAAYYPTVAANVGVNRGAGALNTGNQFSATLDAAWELDVWGRIRRTVESNWSLAQASAADLAAARLSAQATLLVDYMGLRIADQQKRLLDATVKNYERSLQITQNLYKNGVNSNADYLQAKTQLESAQAQAVDIGVARAQYEHAIAVLVGKAPSSFSIPVTESVPDVPLIPVGIPSGLLERRPDIAASERRVAAANAQIGVAKAAFFPTLTLGASGGYEGSSFAHWFSLPNRIWSIGPSLAETIFDAGLRQAQTKAAIATYDQTVANYRQTVLTAFQDVEDNLAALRLLEQESLLTQQAVTDATASARVFLNQYRAGLVSYLNVAVAQNTQLGNEITALNVRKQRLTAAVNLIKALGGGWDRKLP